MFSWDYISISFEKVITPKMPIPISWLPYLIEEVSFEMAGEMMHFISNLSKFVLLFSFKTNVISQTLAEIMMLMMLVTLHKGLSGPKLAKETGLFNS